LGEAVVCWGKSQGFLAGLAGHIFVAVEENLGVEGRMDTNLDGHLPPFGIQNMEVKMVDLRPRLGAGDVLDLAGRAAVHLPDRCRGTGNQNPENASYLRRRGEILPRPFVLSGSGRAEHDGKAAGFSESTNPATETAGQTHPVSVVQSFVTAVQQAPPSAKASRLLPEWKVGIENDTVHTGVALILDIDLKLHGQPSVAGEVLIL
jgi:hypothetical protein